MRTVGIIVEYNPLHNGHLYHFRQSKKESGADAAVAVMSGHFLQRGEPAIANKWARTEMALAMGADLVIELPVAYASQPAEWFAYGAVALLDATGVVDSLCFGSESGDIDSLRKLAKLLASEPEPFRQLVRRQLKTGASYPAAYSEAVRLYATEHATLPPEQQNAAAMLAMPNNSLGLHYLLALERIASRIRPLTITRQKAGYSQTDITDRDIASATAIRRLVFERGNLEEAAAYMPETTLAILRRERAAGRGPMSWDNYFLPLLHQLASRSAEELAGVFEVNEGLEHRLKAALPELREQMTFQALLTALKTKRYTRTKLQRTLLRILLNHNKSGFTSDSLQNGANYLRVLGFSAAGRELLHRMKKTASVPVITNVTNEACERHPFLAMDVAASQVYALGYATPRRDEMFRDYFQPPLKI